MHDFEIEVSSSIDGVGIGAESTYQRTPQEENLPKFIAKSTVMWYRSCSLQF